MVKRVLRFSLIAIAGLLGIVLPVYAADVSDASYVADIVVTNTGTSTTDVSTVCPINTQALIDGKYATSDLLNTALQTQGGGDVPYMPGVGTNPWVFWVSSIGANESKPYLFYTGGPAMQTGFHYFPDTGGMTTDDDDSLEPGNNFRFEQRGYIDTSAGSNKNLVYKQDAFAIGISGEEEISAGISQTTSSTTLNISPNAAGYATGIPSQSPASGAHWDKVDDPPASPDEDATYIYNSSTTYETDYYELANPSFLPGSIIDSVKVYFRVRSASASGYGAYIIPGLRLNEADQDGTEAAHSGTTWATYNQTISRPGGGDWTVSDFADLQIKIQAKSGTSGIGYCTQVYVQIIYYEPVAVTATGITSGVRKVVVEADETDFTISVYDENDVLIDSDTVGIGGGSISPYSSTSDGFIRKTDTDYNTAWAATSGEGIDSGNTTSRVGQDPWEGIYKIDRGYVFFDTSPIPDDATIISATLRLYGYNDSSLTDFNLTIQNGQPTYPHDPLILGDYDKANYSGDGGSLSSEGWNTAGYNDIALNATGLTWISLTGTTRLCLRSSRDIAGTTPTEEERVYFWTGEENGKEPQLVVNYTTGETVPDNDYDWSFITNGSMPYMEYHKIWVNGTLVQHIIYERDTIFDDLTSYDNDATPTFVTTSSDPDVSATFQNFRPIEEAKCAAGTTEEEPEMFTTSPEEPPEFFGGAESGIENLPGASVVNVVLDYAGIPQDFFWIIIVYGLAIGSVLLSYHFIRSSLFWPTIIGGVVILFFSLVTGGNPIPLWSLLIYGILAAGVLVSERVFGW